MKTQKNKNSEPIPVSNNHECKIGKCHKESEDLKAQFKELIVKEINIARSENEKTSRLTSLYNRVSELK